MLPKYTSNTLLIRMLGFPFFPARCASLLDLQKAWPSLSMLKPTALMNGRRLNVQRIGCSLWVAGLPQTEVQPANAAHKPNIGLQP